MVSSDPDTPVDTSLEYVSLSFTPFTGLPPNVKATYNGLVQDFSRKKSIPRPFADLTDAIVKIGSLPVDGGGYGDIYKGIWDNHHVVALKRIRHVDKNAEEAQKSFLKELSIWTTLHHPHVLPLYGGYVDGGIIHSVSPWMENGNVMHYLKNNPGVNRRNLVRDVCSGVRHLHSRNVIHGDLRGDNILIDFSGKPVVTDFGLARVFRKATDGVNTSLRPPTNIRWTAPEQIASESETNTFPGDVWAFAMLCLEIMTGLIPYHYIENTVRLVFLVGEMGTPPDHPGAEPRHRGLDNGLWDLLLWCWAKEPQDRPDITTVHDSLMNLVPLDSGGSAELSTVPITFHDPLPLTSTGCTSVTIDVSAASTNLAGTVEGPPSNAATSETRVCKLATDLAACLGARADLEVIPDAAYCSVSSTIPETAPTTSTEEFNDTNVTTTRCFSRTEAQSLPALITEDTINGQTLPSTPDPRRSHPLDGAGPEPEDLAQALTLEQAALYRAVSLEDYLSYRREPPARNSCAAVVQNHERVILWVRGCIVGGSSPLERVSSYHYFVKTARHCRKMKNFDSAFAIVAALDWDGITRLPTLKKHISAKDMCKTRELMAKAGGKYFQALEKAKKQGVGCVPCLKLHLELDQNVTEIAQRSSTTFIGFRRSSKASTLKAHEFVGLDTPSVAGHNQATDASVWLGWHLQHVPLGCDRALDDLSNRAFEDEEEGLKKGGHKTWAYPRK